MLVVDVLFMLLFACGCVSMTVAVVYERRMHRHRQPGVSYREATFRRDGGWRNTDLFTEEGLRLQRRASTFGVLGAAFWVFGLLIMGGRIMLS